MNLFILDKNYNKIGILSNQGASPIAPFFDDVYTQELDTGADTYEFSTVSTYLTQELMEIGNHIIFEFNNEHKLFVIIDVEFSHKNGMNTINVYAEGIGFELLEKYIDKFETEGNFNNLLGIILVGTGWEHEVNSKLTAIRKMKYDGEKNLLAIIQDAIKTYNGAEVKFEVDYSSNKIKKKVRVYENGGRGSHIGYRFEYGINVNGITKKEEMPNSKDDTVHYVNGNDIGILLEYDVDVAMRSEEIAQLEIGDTHYVIDHDFNPPLTLTARVGKLEISFSDPTKNKVTLANFKHATGAISQKTHKDDVTGIATNAAQVIVNDYSDHTHPLPEHTHPLPEHTHPELAGSAGSNDDLLKAPRMHSYEFLLYTNKDGQPNLSSHPRTTDYAVLDSPINDGTHPTSEDIYNFLMNEVSVFDVSYRVLDYLEHVKQGTGVRPSNYCLRITPDTTTFCTGHSTTDYTDACTMSLAGSRIFSDIIDPNIDRPDFEDGLTLLDDPNNSNISNDHHDKHMLDVGSLACGLVSALQHHVKNGGHGSAQFFEERTEESTGATVAYATKDVWYAYGIHFNKYAVNHDDHVIDEAHTIETKYINWDYSNATSDISLKENIRYIDASAMPAMYNSDGSNVYKENLETRDYSTEDLLEKTDLYDFIVNQLNLCEYNFIDDSVKQIGFIANEYEDTKVGDKIVSRNKKDTLTYSISNLLFATIGALQEEVRTKDEKIASLEDRLAKIEAMLGINNDN